MNLNQLLDRAKEIENAIVNAGAQLNALHGHKAETEHWIQQLQPPAQEEHLKNDETQVETIDAPVVE